MRYFKFTFFLLLVLAVSLHAAFVAVLETVADAGIKNKVSLTDRQYLTNVLREQAVKELPATQNYTIMTRENITEMLPPDKSIEDCEGSCIVETGKNIAADYICQARVSSFNGSLTLSAELYETAGNKLIASFNGLGPNLSTLLTLIIQKSPEFFHNVKKDMEKKAPKTVAQPQPRYSNNVAPNTATTAPTTSTPRNVNPNAGYEYMAPTAKSKANEPWSRASFFIHAGILDAGLGLKLRLSRQNGVYITADARWLSFNNKSFMHVPLMFYLGGNHVHFITGLSILAWSSNESSDNYQFPIGLNVDIGKHFGIDGLFFAPSKSSHSTSLALDFRIIF